MDVKFHEEIRLPKNQGRIRNFHPGKCQADRHKHSYFSHDKQRHGWRTAKIAS